MSNILPLLKNIGAIITDSHIVYASGRHGSAYINKDAVYPDTELVSSLSREMALFFRNEPVDVVAGPTLGGVVLSQWIAHHLSELTGRKILGVFAEEDENKNRFFKRGYDKLVAGKKVLVVEDVLTTGGSVKKVVEAVRLTGGTVVGCVALCNRGGISREDVGSVPVLKSLLSLTMDSWKEEACPLCKKGVPINTDVGKGRDYLTKKSQ